MESSVFVEDLGHISRIFSRKSVEGYRVHAPITDPSTFDAEYICQRETTSPKCNILEPSAILRDAEQF